MDLIIALWIILGLITTCFPVFYYLYMRYVSFRPWNLRVNRSFLPPVTILIPTYNEEKNIDLKLRNLYKLSYPKDNIQIIVTDDGSVDNTVGVVERFINIYPTLELKILKNMKQSGKPNVLNLALKCAKHDIIVMTDADAFLDPKIMVEALPYLSDPSVGAVVGRQKVLNSKLSLATKSENFYNSTFNTIRLGESKIHSTVISHGSFVAYKKEFLKEFNIESDDSGTALDILQRGARIIHVPEAICFDLSPVSWRNRFLIKIRRANHNVNIYAKCLRFLLKNQLHLPKRIAVPEVFLYIVNPIIFLAFVLTTAILFLTHLPYSLIIPIASLLVVLSGRGRLILLEALQSNIILLLALLMFVSKKRFIAWSTRRETELNTINSLLVKNGLV